ncbi:MAG TPA: methyltransferase MtaB domain-containing protein [Planctomycetota bacterium]|jgi:methanol--5-hydroxybenzimidazolylcobamide Co-methyltransferase
MKRFDKLAITKLDDFIYGRAPLPVQLKNGLSIGGGTVYPELNFTLPPIDINAETMPQVCAEYTEMIEGACARAVELQAPGLVVEFELLPPMTMQPEWGAEITAILRNRLNEYARNDGLKSALRVTPNDIRDHERPPKMKGHLWDKMVRSFELCCQAGADFLAIESTGGKEVNDDAMLDGDIRTVTFALGSLASRDMAFLWDKIVKVCDKNGAIASGDTACGFGNTAMVLADRKYLPRVFAATIRVMTVARSLVAYERGAVGPSKDCAYEGPYLKAITGCPIAMEGAIAACAHLSPVGNVSQALADLWSNESVQNVKLLGGMAPTVCVEQLIFATRLMNVASQHGPQGARMLRDWLVESDAKFDPQAYVLRPDVVLKLSKEIIQEPTPYLRTRRAAIATLALLREAVASGAVSIPPMEQSWLSRLSSQADTLPVDEEQLIAEIVPALDPAKVAIGEYLTK